MIAVLLAVIAAILWGCSTFLAARFAKGIPAIPLTLWSQLIGLILIMPVVVVVGGLTPDLAEPGYGSIAGVGVAVSLVMLYMSITRLAVGLAASIAGAIGTVGPVVFSIVTGIVPSHVALVGILVTVIALSLLLIAPDHPDQPPIARISIGVAELDEGDHRGRDKMSRTYGIALAAASGLLMTIYYVALGHLEEGIGFWVLAESRTASTVVLIAACLPLAGRAIISLPQMLVAAWIGVTGATGGAVYILAVGAGGPLTVIVPVVALAPAVSVILGRCFASERLTRVQIGALTLAAAGIVAVVQG